MKVRKLVQVGLVIELLVLIATEITLPLAEAKRRSTFDGHPVMVYEGDDIPDHLQPFVSKIIYDLSPFYYSDPGVKLYLTGKGRIFSQSWYIALSIAQFITAQPEWRNSGSDRNRYSVATEIKWHAWNVFWTSKVYIEYFTRDMRNPPYY
ncbi:MAG: hypothetical protein COS98_02480 [Parcubacteria group bacterium CG07_land_8_20_14_0_80_35_11]|nr:MAG: hypothetical protein COS98_02480 [Parcubacteria group bacterium CG07_land_8_20_14_0_80_35_11]